MKSPWKLTPREAELLDQYQEILSSRALDLGLIGHGEREIVRSRHIDDSLRAVDCLQGSDRLLADVGSGAGLPGIPIAIALPHVHVVLIEPRRRGAAFLEFVADSLSLRNVEVRAESAGETRLSADAVTARALRGALETWQLARGLLRPGGRIIYFAGKSWRPPTAAEGGHDELPSFDICSPKMFPWQGPLVIMKTTSLPASKGASDPRTR